VEERTSSVLWRCGRMKEEIFGLILGIVLLVIAEISQGCEMPIPKYKNLITEAIIHNKADHYSLIYRYRKKQYCPCEE